MKFFAHAALAISAAQLPILFIPSGANGPQKWYDTSEKIHICMICPRSTPCTSNTIQFRSDSNQWKDIEKSRVESETEPSLLIRQQINECRDFTQAEYPEGNYGYELVAFSLDHPSYDGLLFLRARERRGWKLPVIYGSEIVPRVNGVLQYAPVPNLRIVKWDPWMPKNNEKMSITRTFDGIDELQDIYPESDAVKVYEILLDARCALTTFNGNKLSDFDRVMVESVESRPCVIQFVKNMVRLSAQYPWIVEIIASNDIIVTYFKVYGIFLDVLQLRLRPQIYESLFQHALGDRRRLRSEIEGSTHIVSLTRSENHLYTLTDRFGIWMPKFREAVRRLDHTGEFEDNYLGIAMQDAYEILGVSSGGASWDEIYSAYALRLLELEDTDQTQAELINRAYERVRQNRDIALPKQRWQR